MKFHRLYKESSSKLTKDEFDTLFYDYVDSADQYYCRDGYKSKEANMLNLRMEQFIDIVKSNVSREYKYDDPEWERRVSKVINELDDIICDGRDDWIERKRMQLWRDFIAYKSLPQNGMYESSAPLSVGESTTTGNPKFKRGDEVLYFDRSWKYEHCVVVKVHRDGNEFNYDLDGIGSFRGFEYAFEDQMLPFPEEKAVEVLEKRIGTDDEADIDKDALQLLKSVLKNRETANRRTYASGRSDRDSDDVSDKPESIYMRSGRYGSPNWTGD